MRSLIAIVLALLVLLPHPALLAAMACSGTDCDAAETSCPCCPAGHCPCMHGNEMPAPPQPPAPVRGADFHPVPALPPAMIDLPRKAGHREVTAEFMASAADRARTLPLLPLHVRLCVFLN